MKLKSIYIEGYKSINQEGQTINFGDITVLIGANGVGKSNLVSFFKMLNHITTGALQSYIASGGFADAFLNYGSKQTNNIKAEIKFSDLTTDKTYNFTLSSVSGDFLAFTNEEIKYDNKHSNLHHNITLNSGARESALIDIAANSPDQEHKSLGIEIINLLQNCKIFHFHDTTDTSKIKIHSYIEDNYFLRSDGGNLAAFLYGLKSNSKFLKYYERIIRHIQMVMPQFGDFELHPASGNERYIMLNWKDRGGDFLFGPHQISDGSLRFMLLTTLLLQPNLPNVVVLDEPELGLHPSAIAYLAGMVKSASQRCQVVIATQSPRLVDEFDIENVVVVERNSNKNCSEFKSLDEEKLHEWLERYSLSELWEKNILGGQP
jgi:predicted ATPase